jgi:Helix-turn-helix domain
LGRLVVPITCRRAASEICYPMAEDTNETAPVRRVMWGRRFLAATVVVPPDVAELLNTDAMAVLAVIRDEARATGKCTLPVARIAERANIGRAKTRAAIRLAESLGLIAIEQEPGRKRAIINRGVTSRC